MQKNIPFDFVFDYLFPLEVKVKPMFGLFALYIGEKLVLMLRQRKQHSEINGVWIATSKDHHKSLRKAFPSLRSLRPLQITLQKQNGNCSPWILTTLRNL